MKKYIRKASVALMLVGGMVSVALAAITVQSGPTSLVTTPRYVKAASDPVGLFKFNLTQDAGETLSSVSVRVNAVVPSTVASENIASLSVYKDNGDGLFDPSTDLLAGTQTAVNIGSTTTITTAANNNISTSTTQGNFFVGFRTAASWRSTSTPDTIQVVFPSDGIVTSASSPTVSSTATADIIADTVAPTLLSAVAFDTGITSAKTSGDSIVFTFSEATNKPAITSTNATSTFMVNNGHSLLDGSGDLGLAVWNVSGTTLTLTFTGTSTVPTVELGDAIAIGGSLIQDAGGNAAAGSATLTGTFGSIIGTTFDSTITTHVRNASNVDITNTSVVFGTAVHDYATVVGVGSTTTATGTVTFTLYNNGTCNGSVLSAQDVALTSGTAASNATSTLAIGSYSYKANYTGNNLYHASTAACEPFTIIQAPAHLTPVIASNILNASNTSITGQTVTTGTVVHDYVVVSGSGGTPTGNVDFMRYSNGTCSGDPAATENNVSLNGIGAAASSNFTTVAGVLSYRVHYDGNGTYLPADGGCQALTVQDVVPPTPQTNCENGLINGRLYMVTGKSKVFLAAACRLKEFKGNAVGHAKGKKFQDIIPLPSSSVDDNGTIVKTFTIIMLDKKPMTIRADADVRKDKEKGRGSIKVNASSSRDTNSKDDGRDEDDD
ncbi:MAG: Ig-like domain repeat protein [Candidatus Komeilibacteria bacterium]|nr:Ig-like domain repeat protein [Candidatus Komeilibacteria bacterium]